MAFRVGMKVECIRARPWVCTCCGLRGDGPQHREVMEVAGIDGDFLIFSQWPDGSFHKIEFRPIVEPDISIFTAMLTPKKATELV